MRLSEYLRVRDLTAIDTHTQRHGLTSVGGVRMERPTRLASHCANSRIEQQLWLLMEEGEDRGSAAERRETDTAAQGEQEQGAEWPLKRRKVGMKRAVAHTQPAHAADPRNILDYYLTGVCVCVCVCRTVLRACPIFFVLCGCCVGL